MAVLHLGAELQEGVSREPLDRFQRLVAIFCQRGSVDDQLRIDGPEPVDDVERLYVGGANKQRQK